MSTSGVNNITTTQLANTNSALVPNVSSLSLEDAFGLSSCCSTWCETINVMAITEELTFFNDSYSESERRCLVNKLDKYTLLGGCK